MTVLEINNDFEEKQPEPPKPRNIAVTRVINDGTVCVQVKDEPRQRRSVSVANPPPVPKPSLKRSSSLSTTASTDSGLPPALPYASLKSGLSRRSRKTSWVDKATQCGTVSASTSASRIRSLVNQLCLFTICLETA